MITRRRARAALEELQPPSEAKEGVGKAESLALAKKMQVISLTSESDQDDSESEEKPSDSDGSVMELSSDGCISEEDVENEKPTASAPIDGLLAEEVLKIIKGGDLKKLKLDHCRSYLRNHGMRLAGTKPVLIDRIKQHIELLEGGAEKYKSSSFLVDCTGDVCKGDVVKFNQKVHAKFDVASRRAQPLGKRTVAGRVVKESYGAHKQQHTFTVEVLWSTGFKPLAPMQQLLVKGRNLYRLRTFRQVWEDEGMRKQSLDEKHERGAAARSVRARSKAGVSREPRGSTLRRPGVGTQRQIANPYAPVAANGDAFHRRVDRPYNGVSRISFGWRDLGFPPEPRMAMEYYRGQTPKESYVDPRMDGRFSGVSSGSMEALIPTETRMHKSPLRPQRWDVPSASHQRENEVSCGDAPNSRMLANVVHGSKSPLRSGRLDLPPGIHRRGDQISSGNATGSRMQTPNETSMVKSPLRSERLDVRPGSLQSENQCSPRDAPGSRIPNGTRVDLSPLRLERLDAPPASHRRGDQIPFGNATGPRIQIPNDMRMGISPIRSERWDVPPAPHHRGSQSSPTDARGTRMQVLNENHTPSLTQMDKSPLRLRRWDVPPSSFQVGNQSSCGEGRGYRMQISEEVFRDKSPIRSERRDIPPGTHQKGNHNLSNEARGSEMHNLKETHLDKSPLRSERRIVPAGTHQNANQDLSDDLRGTRMQTPSENHIDTSKLSSERLAFVTSREKENQSSRGDATCTKMQIPNEAHLEQSSLRSERRGLQPAPDEGVNQNSHDNTTDSSMPLLDNAHSDRCPRKTGTRDVPPTSHDRGFQTSSGESTGSRINEIKTNKSPLRPQRCDVPTASNQRPFPASALVSQSTLFASHVSGGDAGILRMPTTNYTSWHQSPPRRERWISAGTTLFFVCRSDGCINQGSLYCSFQSCVYCCRKKGGICTATRHKS